MQFGLEMSSKPQRQWDKIVNWLIKFLKTQTKLFFVRDQDSQRQTSQSKRDDKVTFCVCNIVFVTWFIRSNTVLNVINFSLHHVLILSEILKAKKLFYNI